MKDNSKTIILRPPLKGVWRYLSPPGHHPYAFDFVQTNDHKRSHQGMRWHWWISHILSEHYYCWNKPVYAPIAGKVIRACDGWHDHHSTSLRSTIHIWIKATFLFRPQLLHGRLDIRPNAGNHIMIQADEGYIVFLAHLREQSICVKEGQQVEAGQALARIGNSGNSTAPHLHINLFDQYDDPMRSKILPFILTEYETLNMHGDWHKTRLTAPDAGEFIRFVDSSES